MNISALYYGNRRKTQAVHALWLCILPLIASGIISLASADCTLHKTDATDRDTENKLLQMLDPLKGHIFNLSEGGYNYTLGICTDLGDKTFPGAGVVQCDLKDAAKKNFSLGRYDDVEIMGGTDWILLTYNDGSQYGKHCNGGNRTSYIMVICDPNVVVGNFRKLEERRMEKSDDCFYLFEIGSSVSCNARQSKQEDPHLSSGSVFCIIAFTFAGIYLLLGFLYQRIVIGAKGLEQIPNYAFWRGFGNLQADGCDYLCRCGPRQESQAYRGIDDRIRTDEERDDQLLNM